MSETVNLRFDGTFADGLTFIEAENQDGESVTIGEWYRDDDYHILQLEAAND